MRLHPNLTFPTVTLIVSVFFLLLVQLFFLRQQWTIALLPVALFILLYSFFRPDLLFFGIVCLTPLSINLEEMEWGEITFYLPTEPLLFGLSILILLAHLHSKILPHTVLYHPVSLCFYIYFFWTFLTALTSAMPVVSLKYLISRIWFIVPVYFFAAALFLDTRNVLRFALTYLFPLLAVVIYTTLRHRSFGFEEAPAHWVMEPFYRDHTQYGAVVAFYIPILAGLLGLQGLSWKIRIAGLLVLCLLFFTLIFTFSRAALLSVLLTGLLWIVIKTRINLKFVGMGIFVFLLVIIWSFENILQELQRNRIDSSENLIENVESITNITTDASNLERINRWNSVIEMTRERPLFGFGPGTFMFEYAPYQKSKDMTIISTNFGDVGNAHSEFLGPMAEMGIPGFIMQVLLLFFVFKASYLAYHRLHRGLVKNLLLAFTLSLVTYYTHGILNNFLDSDKASVPVYGAIAVIVAIEIYSRSLRRTT